MPDNLQSLNFPKLSNQVQISKVNGDTLDTQGLNKYDPCQFIGVTFIGAPVHQGNIHEVTVIWVTFKYE